MLKSRDPWTWLYVGTMVTIVSAMIWIFLLILAIPVPPAPVYEYRLVSPDEAKVLVNEQGWQVSQRMQPTDNLVYVVHRK